MRIILTAMLLFTHMSLIFAQEIAKIERINITSKALQQDRTILVYTPKFYTEHTLINYDVVYVFDAQNREFFDIAHALTSFVSNAEKRYIFVGVTSPYIEELDYARNNDLLPDLQTKKAKNYYSNTKGNADTFLNYVTNKVIPYVEQNYRIKDKRIAIGHSLSASFVLYSFFKHPNMFDAHFAISPNFAYDNKRIANALVSFDFSKRKKPNFMYLSHANEGDNYWLEWKPAREKVYGFIDGFNKNDNTTFVKNAYPSETHWTTFAPSLSDGLKAYFNYEQKQEIKFSEEDYTLTVSLRTHKPVKDVYITGNQASLGNWTPNAIRMNKVSDTLHNIELKVKKPVEIKITKGSWESQASLKRSYGFDNIWVDPEKKNNLELEVFEWADDEH